jgi:hypothetical protein
MKCQTITEVIKCLDEIIITCEQTNNACGYFAVLYNKVTKRVQLGIKNNEFDNNALMETLDVVFANRYLEAYSNYQEGKPLTQSWEIAFNACKKNESIVLQHLLSGINAHINLDLGIASVDTMGSLPLNELKNNFHQINQVLSNMIDDVKKDIGKISPLFKILMPLAKRLDEKMIQFSITTARDAAWEFAQQLAQSTNREIEIQQRDKMIAELGYGILHPGRILSMILRTMRMVEFKNVQQQLKILNN